MTGAEIAADGGLSTAGVAWMRARIQAELQRSAGIAAPREPE
jgi:hypothetical protein